jgi:D-amino-acid dehydrogenase
MHGSIRYGGTMELDRINKKVNMQRVKGIIESVPRYFPDLKPRLPEVEQVWFGFRPSSPDGLPYIGYSKVKNLIVATGHGMMGLSLGPATGAIVSQLVDEEKPAIDIAAFSPSRFNHS